MNDLFNLKKPYIWIILLFIAISITYSKSSNIENFLPWNMGTRFFPSYDIRGYPYIYPWNYPYPGLPWLYWSPYFYKTNGKYIFDPKYAKLLRHAYMRAVTP